MVVELQQMIHGAAVNNVLYYGDALQAYRSDRFTGIETQPAKGGVVLAQNGPWGLYSATPVAQEAQEAAGGTPIWWIVGGVAAVVVVGGGILLLRRRAGVSDDRE